MGLSLPSLSSINPATLGTKIAIYVAVVSVIFGTGAGIGYKYEAGSIAREKLAESENARRLEHTDSTQGNTAAAKVRASENTIDQNTAAVVAAIPKTPQVVVKWKTPDCPISTPSTGTIPNTTNSEVAKHETDTPIVSLTASAQRLYDLSLQPGNTDIRTGTYEESRTIPVDEGLQIIDANNGVCAKIANRLDSLIDRIQEKQKTFGQAGQKE